MNFKTILFSTALVAVLCGCASAPKADDPVRQRVLADLAQARADGSYPVTEKQFVYPYWPELVAHQRAGRGAAQAN